MVDGTEVSVAEAEPAPRAPKPTSQPKIANRIRATPLRKCVILFYPFVLFCHFLVEVGGCQVKNRWANESVTCGCG
ncbi:MAG TPA: hypothetical protein VGD53_02215, partial [Actinoallomurus sp.]